MHESWDREEKVRAFLERAREGERGETKREQGRGEREAVRERKGRKARTGHKSYSGRPPTKAAKERKQKEWRSELAKTQSSHDIQEDRKGRYQHPINSTEHHLKYPDPTSSGERHQKEDLPVKVAHGGTRNTKRRERDKKRNQEPGTSKLRKGPRAKQARREDAQERRRRD